MIESVTPLVSYLGDYPTAPLTAATSGSWLVSVRVDLVSMGAVRGKLRVQGSWSDDASAESGVDGSSSTFWLNLTATNPTLWWPNGMGRQDLHSVNVTFAPAAGRADAPTAVSVSASARFGFRYAVLVTTNDTNSALRQAAATGEGSAGHTMMFRVNGAPVLARGANFNTVFGVRAHLLRVAGKMC